MGVMIFKTKDVQVNFPYNGPKGRPDVNVVDVEPSRVVEFDRPENQTRLFQPECWPALYARLEALGQAGIVPNIYVAHPLRSPDDPDSKILDYVMGSIILFTENTELSAKHVYFMDKFALRAVDGNRQELALMGKVKRAGERIDRVYFPDLFLNPHARWIEKREEQERINAQVNEDLSRRVLELNLWWGTDIIGPTITVADMWARMSHIVKISVVKDIPIVFVDFNLNIFENDTILVSSIIDEQRKKISGVVLAYEKDGKVLREFFGKAQADKVQADSGGSGSGDRGGAEANSFSL